MLKRLLRYLAFKRGKFVFAYLKICKPQSDENAEFHRARNTFYAMGKGCRVNISATITDPKYVKLGNNVCLSACTLIGHDGAVAVFAKATGKVLDKVGKIEIGDNCFIGHGAIVMPNVKIGSNVIVAAGSVVTKDIPDGCIVGGVPAKVIGSTAEYIDKTEAATREYPWYDLIKTRTKAYDPAMEGELLVMRLKHFYG